MRPKGYNIKSKEATIYPDSKYEMTVALQNDLNGNNLSIDIALHDPMTIPDLRGSVIEIQPGYMTTVMITPQQIQTSEDALSLNPLVRNCKFKQETEHLKLFKEYSQSACLLECQLKIAYDYCQCIPWNYPQFQSGMPVCHAFGMFCFEQTLQNYNLNCTEDCLDDCSITRYSYSVSAIKIADDPGFVEQIVQQFQPFFKHYDNIMEGGHGFKPNPEKLDDEFRSRIAVVKFKLASKTVTQIKRSVRVSFSETLSNIGINFYQRFHELQLDNFLLFRWNTWTFHWNKLSKLV